MQTEQVHNFNAGPAIIPKEVLLQAQAELHQLPSVGMSIVEISHRSPQFQKIIDQARSNLTELYQIPSTHEILFLQGGASLQFAMIPMNIGTGGAYINTGTWSTRALSEAQIQGEAIELWSGKESQFTHVPTNKELEIQLAKLRHQPRYLHYTSNNTIYGTQFPSVPSVNLPLIADFSSDFISRPIDFSCFDLVYAGAQKNAGPSGLTILIIRKDISRSDSAIRHCPKILKYMTHAEKDSMYNTPNTFGIYLFGLVTQWALDQGGLAIIDQTNKDKARLLYSVIDSHPSIYKGRATLGSRSLMNVTFDLCQSSLTSTLLQRCSEAGIVGIKGHRSVGGFRASIYNALPQSSVERLAELLDEFAICHSK